TCSQKSPERQQIAHVVEGIANLLLRERPTTPFRERLALDHLHAQKLTDQRGMAERVRQTDEACGKLQIKKIAWRPACAQMAQTHLLTAGMDNHQVGRIHHDVPKGIEGSDGGRVDQEELLGGGDLEQ